MNDGAICAESLKQVIPHFEKKQCTSTRVGVSEGLQSRRLVLHSRTDRSIALRDGR